MYGVRTLGGLCAYYVASGNGGRDAYAKAAKRNLRPAALHQASGAKVLAGISLQPDLASSLRGKLSLFIDPGRAVYAGVSHLDHHLYLIKGKTKPGINSIPGICFAALNRYTLRSTLPERRQRVQTFSFCGEPFTNACTVSTLGAQPRLVLRLEWLTLLPDITPLLHTSQYLPMLSTSLPNTSNDSSLKHAYSITFGLPLQRKFRHASAGGTAA